MQQKKICHDSVVVQKDDTSSMENSRPPTGAPKAEATPAAAPADTKLRLTIRLCQGELSLLLSILLSYLNAPGLCVWMRLYYNLFP